MNSLVGLQTARGTGAAGAGRPIPFRPANRIRHLAAVPATPGGRRTGPPWTPAAGWVAVLADPARVRPGDAAALDDEVHRLITESDPDRIAAVAAAAFALDRVAGCREPLRRMLDGARRGPAAPSTTTAFAVLCGGDVATGRWDEAAELATEGIALCTELGDHLTATSLHLAVGLVAAARGDELRSRSIVERVTGWAAPRGVRSVVDEGHRVLALAALGRGAAEDAFRHATAVTPPGRLAPGAAALRVSFDLVDAAVRLGRHDDARRHAAAMLAAPVHVVSERFAMLTAAAAALVAPADEAEALFQEALAAPDADRWPFDQARIQLAYGEHLRRLRRTRPARVVLAAALDTFERLAAHPWAACARHGLRATGVTTGHQAAGADLTPDERAVATLAAAGLTNKEIARRLIVSHHTVAARLYQIFPKLGIGSRAALRDALLALDGGTAFRLAVSG